MFCPVDLWPFVVLTYICTGTDGVLLHRASLLSNIQSIQSVLLKYPTSVPGPDSAFVLFLDTHEHTSTSLPWIHVGFHCVVAPGVSATSPVDFYFIFVWRMVGFVARSGEGTYVLLMFWPHGNMWVDGCFFESKYQEMRCSSVTWVLWLLCVGVCVSGLCSCIVVEVWLSGPIWEEVKGNISSFVLVFFLICISTAG